MANRIKIVFVAISLAFVSILARLFYWQVIKGDELSKKAQNQYTRGSLEDSSRGEIMDANGSWLVANVESWLIYADPGKLEGDPAVVANKLAPLLAGIEITDQEQYKVAVYDETQRLKELLFRSNLSWIALKQKVSPEVKQNIEALGIKGLGYEENQSRYYPEGSVSAQLLGFVGKDIDGQDKGYFGLEGYYDITLTGKQGFREGEWDLLGNPLLLSEEKESPAISGIGLKTTIIKTLQNTVYKKLAKGIEKFGAEGGNVVIMNPKTGAIVAMESFPSFDPRTYSEFGNDLFVNPIVSHSFEPGSVFKIVVMAAALDADVVTPNTICTICSGPLPIGTYNIRTWNDQYYPDSTMTEVIVHSDNVGMSFISQKMGRDRMYDYLQKFGFGQKTAIDLQGEIAPSLRKIKDWHEIDTATVSFGQGIAVTPIQIIQAVSAIANGGKLHKPYVVDSLIGESWEQAISKENPKKVISKKAADEITKMMIEAANYGESKWTHRKGYGVAGKTGTAQIPIEGHYDEKNTIASFVGFAPYDDPQFAMLVTLRKPQSSPWASETAAPLWYSIAEDLFDYYKIAPK